MGKTTFAVHAAHRLTGSFPDGQFFLPLHAYTRGQQPVDPADALASLLLTAGVAAAQIPPGLDARAARWRHQVAGRRILLLLDDAASHEQVQPLLPGTVGSLVLVTSRRRLTALHDAAVISLDTFPPAEATTLLARLAARPGLHAGDAAVDVIARLCGYLPLAIGMLASQLRHHPAWTVAGLAADLAAARDRLALMHAENVSVAAAAARAPISCASSACRPVKTAMSRGRARVGAAANAPGTTACAAASTFEAGPLPRAAATNNSRAGPGRLSASARRRLVSLWAVRLTPRSRSLIERWLRPVASASSSCVSLASARSCRNSPAKLSSESATGPSAPHNLPAALPAWGGK